MTYYFPSLKVLKALEEDSPSGGNYDIHRQIFVDYGNSCYLRIMQASMQFCPVTSKAVSAYIKIILYEMAFISYPQKTM